MNDDLRNMIWNFLYVAHLGSGDEYAQVNSLCFTVHTVLLKKTVDTIPVTIKERIGTIRLHFFSLPWHRIYDLLELVVAQAPNLVEGLNKVLDRENAGYRIVAGNVVDIVDTEELAEIRAAATDTAFTNVASHLKNALSLYSNKEYPDFRNSIKESVSAVEAMACHAAGIRNATLSDALRMLEKKGKLHGALKEGFTRLYGYTSDAGGIRHAMMDESNITKSDARFFLAACASFINYLKSNL